MMMTPCLGTDREPCSLITTEKKFLHAQNALCANLGAVNYEPP